MDTLYSARTRQACPLVQQRVKFHHRLEWDLLRAAAES